MGSIRPVSPVKLICGVIAVPGETAGKVKAALEERFGPVETESDFIPFDFTYYYREEMGAELVRKLYSFSQLIDPVRLPGIKRWTMQVEESLALERNGRICRTANIDPGYLTASKVVLATTKDFSHRLYLGEGIYGEVTLGFRKDGIITFHWTYPDYKSGAYTPFLMSVRAMYMEQTRDVPQ